MALTDEQRMAIRKAHEHVKQAYAHLQEMAQSSQQITVQQLFEQFPEFASVLMSSLVLSTIVEELENVL